MNTFKSFLSKIPLIGNNKTIGGFFYERLNNGLYEENLVRKISHGQIRSVERLTKSDNLFGRFLIKNTDDNGNINNKFNINLNNAFLLFSSRYAIGDVYSNGLEKRQFVLREFNNEFDFIKYMTKSFQLENKNVLDKVEYSDRYSDIMIMKLINRVNTVDLSCNYTIDWLKNEIINPAEKIINNISDLGEDDIRNTNLFKGKSSDFIVEGIKNYFKNFNNDEKIYFIDNLFAFVDNMSSVSFDINNSIKKLIEEINARDSKKDTKRTMTEFIENYEGGFERFSQDIMFLHGDNKRNISSDFVFSRLFLGYTLGKLVPYMDDIVLGKYIEKITSYSGGEKYRHSSNRTVTTIIKGVNIKYSETDVSDNATLFQRLQQASFIDKFLTLFSVIGLCNGSEGYNNYSDISYESIKEKEERIFEEISKQYIGRSIMTFSEITAIKKRYEGKDDTMKLSELKTNPEIPIIGDSNNLPKNIGLVEGIYGYKLITEFSCSYRVGYTTPQRRTYIKNIKNGLDYAFDKFNTTDIASLKKLHTAVKDMIFIEMMSISSGKRYIYGLGSSKETVAPDTDALKSFYEKMKIYKNGEIGYRASPSFKIIKKLSNAYIAKLNNIIKTDNLAEKIRDEYRILLQDFDQFILDNMLFITSEANTSGPEKIMIISSVRNGVESN